MQLHVYLEEEKQLNDKAEFIKKNLDIPIIVHVDERGEKEIKGKVMLHFLPALVLIDEKHDRYKEDFWISNVREIWSGTYFTESSKKDLLRSIKKRLKEVNGRMRHRAR